MLRDGPQSVFCQDKTTITDSPPSDEHSERFQVSFERRPQRRRHPVLVFGVAISFGRLLQYVDEAVLGRPDENIRIFDTASYRKIYVYCCNNTRRRKNKTYSTISPTQPTACVRRTRPIAVSVARPLVFDPAKGPRTRPKPDTAYIIASLTSYYPGAV